MRVVGSSIDGIEWAQIVRFASEVAAMPVNQPSPVWLANYSQVGELAADYADTVLCTDSLMRDTTKDVHLTVAIGMLLYSLDYHGLTIDDVADRAGMTVARALAQISGDPRIIYPRRMYLTASQLAAAEPYAQLAVLAETAVRAVLVAEEAGSQSLCLQVRSWIEAWLQGKQQVLDALTVFAHTEPYRECRQRLAAVSQQLKGRCKLKRKSKGQKTCQT